MEYNITVRDGGIEEDEGLPSDIKSESPQLHENGEVCTLVITARAVQVGGKDNSIVQQERNDDSDESYEKQRGRNTKRTKRTRRAKQQVKKKNTDVAVIERTVHQSVGPVSLSAAGRQFFRMSDDIMIQLQQVRDEGQWKTFDEVAFTLSRRYPSSLEAQVIIMTERGHAACYNNRFKESKKLLKEARSMASGTANAELLIGRTNYYLSAVYRREKKTGKAIDCVKTACQNLHHTGLVLDTAMLTYERASALMDFILQCADPIPSCKEKVMRDLRRAIDQILALKEDSSRRYLKTHRYAFIKMAFLLLDCRTAAGRQRTVSENDIKEAKKYLNVIKEKYWKETTRGEKIQFFLAQSDLHFRMKLYEEAEKYAFEALSMAEEFGFNTEIQLVNDRLKDIRQVSASTKGDGFHSNKKLVICLDGGNSAGNHGNSALVDRVDGNRNTTINDIPADVDGDRGNTTSDISIDDSDSKTGSSEGYFDDASASSDPDMLENHLLSDSDMICMRKGIARASCGRAHTSLI